jgi:hypothetical protein
VEALSIFFFLSMQGNGDVQVDMKLTHPLETISAFATLKLTMPLTKSEVCCLWPPMWRGLIHDNHDNSFIRSFMTIWIHDKSVISSFMRIMTTLIHDIQRFLQCTRSHGISEVVYKQLFGKVYT